MAGNMNDDLADEIKKFIKNSIRECLLNDNDPSNDATYLHIVNNSTVAITVSLMPVGGTEKSRVVIGNVAAKLTTVPVDLRDRGLSDGTNYRLSIKPQTSTSAWVTFNPEFTFITTPPKQTPFMRASFQLSAKGSWICSGPTFGPATAAKVSRNSDGGDEELPGDPIDA